MKINIKTNELGRYLWILKILNITVPQFRDLRFREIEVLSYLYYSYNNYSSLSEEEKNTLTFDKTNKKRICDDLNITPEHLYNILVRLRKLGFIEEDRIKLNIKPVNEIIIKLD